MFGLNRSRITVASFVVSLLAPSSLALAATPDTPEAFGVTDRDVILSVHAEGAQIYDCKVNADGQTAWAFREPIAALFSDGKTVGRHYLGPNWDLTDGSGVKGKLSMSAPGQSSHDVALLKLDVAEHRGEGVLKAATTVLRLNTHGGDLKGPCDKAGDLHAEPYSADYVFLR